jgi:hypothetical protein
VLLVPCTLLVLSVAAMAWSVPGHNDGHDSGSSGCRDWKRYNPGCPPPAPPTTKPPYKPPPKPPYQPPSKPPPSKPPPSKPPSTTTTSTQPAVAPATIPEPPAANASADVPAVGDSLRASGGTVGSSVSDVPTAQPVTDIVAAPVLPGLPQAVPTLEQPEVPPAASFEDDVLLPGSIALVIAIAGLATAFLVYQGAAGRRGPRGPAGPVDDGETLEFQ